jgi:hypothetical protein
MVDARFSRDGGDEAVSCESDIKARRYHLLGAYAEISGNHTAQPNHSSCYVKKSKYDF